MPVRNPHSTRPFQHVLEPLYAYLMIAAAQYEDGRFAGYYNVGPGDEDLRDHRRAGGSLLPGLGRRPDLGEPFHGRPHEASFLKLDCSRLRQVFGWKPVWGIREAVEKTVEWTKAWQGRRGRQSGDGQTDPGFYGKIIKENSHVENMTEQEARNQTWRWWTATVRNTIISRNLFRRGTAFPTHPESTIQRR